MTDFGKFCKEYCSMKESMTLTKAEVKVLRRAFESLNEKKVSEKKPEEKVITLEEAVKGYKGYKESKGDKSPVTKAEAKSLINHLHESGVKVVSEKKMAEAKKPAAKKTLKEAISFPEYVRKFREYKVAKGLSKKLTESEKKLLVKKYYGNSAKFEEKKEPTAEQKRYMAECKKYSAWKISNGQNGKLTESEKVLVAKGVKADMLQESLVEKVTEKLNEAKVALRNGRTKLLEGDQMDAGAFAQDAGAALGAANAAAADPMMAQAGVQLPQNIVDEIAQIKSAVDVLATEAGVQSPVDLSADPNAGIPAVTGAADAGMAPAAPAAAPAVDPATGAPLAESISDISARIAARESKIATENFMVKAPADPALTATLDNPNLKDPHAINVGDTKLGTTDNLKVPSTKELIDGVATGSVNCQPADTWKAPKNPGDLGKAATKLGNIQESDAEEISKRVRESLDENGNFSWDRFVAADN